MIEDMFSSWNVGFDDRFMRISGIANQIAADQAAAFELAIFLLGC